MFTRNIFGTPVQGSQQHPIQLNAKLNVENVFPGELIQCEANLVNLNKRRLGDSADKPADITWICAYIWGLYTIKTKWIRSPHSNPSQNHLSTPTKQEVSTFLPQSPTSSFNQINFNSPPKSPNALPSEQ